MTSMLHFDPELADEAQVRWVSGRIWRLVIVHAPDTPLGTWDFQCPGTFFPDVLDILEPLLTGIGVGHRGSAEWDRNGLLRSALLHPLP